MSSHKLDPMCIQMLIQQRKLDDTVYVAMLEQKEPIKALQVLLEHRCYLESIFLLSFGLPAQERVWWSYLAALKAEGEHPSEQVLAALTVIRQWVHQPQPELATQAQAAAEVLNAESAARWAALGLFWSQDNIGYKNKSSVKANPMMAKLAAAHAVIKSLDHAQEQERQFLTMIFQGIHIAAGGNGQLSEKDHALIAGYLKRN